MKYNIEDAIEYYEKMGDLRAIHFLKSWQEERERYSEDHAKTVELYTDEINKLQEKYDNQTKIAVDFMIKSLKLENEINELRQNQCTCGK